MMKLPTSPAGRLAIVHELMRPRIYDDDGNVIGYGEPLLPVEELLKILVELVAG